MFSDNQKISPGQLRSLVVLIVFAKGALLLPFFAAGMTVREFLLGILLVFLLLLGFCRLINALSKNIKDSFFEYVKERLGKWNAVLVSILFLGFLLVNISYLFQAFGTLAHRYILVDQAEVVLMFLALVGAGYLASGGVEVQGRAAEIWFPVLILPILLLLVCAGLHMEVRMSEILDRGVWPAENILLQFGVFGDLAFLVWLLPKGQKREKSRRAFFRGTSVALALLLTLYFILAGTFGKYGIAELSFPAVSLMSAARIPGGFLERWDVIFTSLLLMGLLISAGGSLYIGSLIGQKWFPKIKNRSFAAGFGTIGYLLALILGSYEKNAEYYGWISGYFLVPGMAAVIFLLLWIEKIKRRKQT